MTTLAIADLHLSSNPRDYYRHQFLSKLAARAEKAGVTRTLILGDLTEEKDRHGDWLVNHVVDMVERFVQLGPVIIDQGNHDYYSDPGMPFFGFLRHMSGVTWIGKPTELKLKGLGRCLFLPHTRNHKADWKGLAFAGLDWIFAHNTFKGADAGFGMRLDGIPIEVFPKGSRVVSGDVHVPQKLDCVTYVGAPYLIDFGDEYAPRSLLLTDQTCKSFPGLPSDPQKRLVEIAGVEGLKFFKIHPGDVLKVKVHLSRKDAADWPAIRDEVNGWATEHGAIAHVIAPVLTERAGKPVDFKHRDPKGDKELLQEFAKNRGYDQKTVTAGERLL